MTDQTIPADKARDLLDGTTPERWLEEGQTQRYIGSVYGVSQRTVWGIKNGRSWKHV